MQNPICHSLILVGGALLWHLQLPAHAQAEPVSKVNPEAASGNRMAAPFWTAERFKSARPWPMPMAAPGARHAPAAAQAPGSAAGADGHGPLAYLAPAPHQLFLPDAGLPAPDGRAYPPLAGQGVKPQAVGTDGAHYTSSRVFPLFTGAAAGYSADRAYPYRTVGILFFNVDGGGYLCSASVIQRRVVATAGHCVHSGSSEGFYTDFVFVPAYRDGTAPYLAWRWSYVTTTGEWAHGADEVPNEADYAMLEFADQPLTAGGPAVKLGEVTGWLGWQTDSLAANHTSKLGYPCNLDNCDKMQIVTSASVQITEPNNVEYGSDAQGGSSGGPWVQNFETLADGGGVGMNAGTNRIVGVTSYGYTDEEMKVQGASILDSRWEALWKRICARPGNCN